MIPWRAHTGYYGEDYGVEQGENASHQRDPALEALDQNGVTEWHANRQTGADGHQREGDHQTSCHHHLQVEEDPAGDSKNRPTQTAKTVHGCAHDVEAGHTDAVLTQQDVTRVLTQLLVVPHGCYDETGEETSDNESSEVDKCFNSL